MKRPGGRTRKLQERQIAFLNSLEHNTAIIDSKEKLEKFLGGLDVEESI